jgi:hypothetical protein
MDEGARQDLLSCAKVINLMYGEFTLKILGGKLNIGLSFEIVKHNKVSAYKKTFA